MTMQEVLDSGELFGYAEGDANPIDVQVCLDSFCPVCLAEPQTCRAFRNSAGSYRSFCVCPACGNVEEF